MNQTTKETPVSRKSRGKVLKPVTSFDEKYVKRRYLQPRNPGAFAGLHGFVSHTNYRDITKVKKALQSLNAHNSHVPTRKRFQRRPMICPEIDSVWSVDLADMQNLRTKNRNFAYILVAIDCLSKFLFTRPLKRKTKEEVQQALLDIFKKSKRRPQVVFSDRGLEFKNGLLNRTLKALGTRQFHSFSHLKAFQSERAIRTLKAKLYRYMTNKSLSEWVSGLASTTESINNSINRSIKMSPASVNKKNVSEVWNNLYERAILTTPQLAVFSVGDKVRVSVKKLAVGDKSYTETYGPEIFEIVKILKHHPVVTYKLKDRENRELEGSFYKQELIRIQEPQE